MKDIKIHCYWDINFELKHSKQIELYVDQVPSDPTPDGTIRFVALLEPPEIIDLSQHALNGLKNNTFNYLLTHNQYLLDATDKSYLFEFASTWIKDYQFPEKTFSVSTLVGGKMVAPGHRIRQKVWFKENKIKTPKNFYLSGNLGGIENYNNHPVLGSDKKPLFDSQFHICIENSKRENWFTEKLMDCLQTKTVPVYWGCTNIENWFDTRGFIIVNDFNDIVSSCNELTPETYENMLEYVEENYKKSMEFIEINNRMGSLLKKILEENKC